MVLCEIMHRLCWFLLACKGLETDDLRLKKLKRGASVRRHWSKAASEQTGGEPVQVANFLCNGNYAVSGSIPAIDKVAEIAKPEFKARMVVKLAVAGAFHTDYMQPAAEALEAGLNDTPISEPRIPVISNVNAEPHTDADSIRATLAEQLTSPVQWEKSMKTLLEKA